MQDEAFEQITKGRLKSGCDWNHIFEEVLNFCEGGLKG